jgi:hypothetical protein
MVSVFVFRRRERKMETSAAALLAEAAKEHLGYSYQFEAEW